LRGRSFPFARYSPINIFENDYGYFFEVGLLGRRLLVRCGGGVYGWPLGKAILLSGGSYSASEERIEFGLDVVQWFTISKREIEALLATSRQRFDRSR
jgi:hypothetical protein